MRMRRRESRSSSSGAWPRSGRSTASTSGPIIWPSAPTVARCLASAATATPRSGTRATGRLRETIRVCEAGQFAIRDIAIAPRQPALRGGDGQRHRADLPAQARAGAVEPREPLPVVAARPEPPIDLWKQLIGKPAPEFREIKAWAGGPPVRLADLRGKFVLLHFWGMPSEFQMAELMALHEKFAEQGLVIIVLQPDWGVSRSRIGRPTPFAARNGAIAPCPSGSRCDGGGPTPIEGIRHPGPRARPTPLSAYRIAGRVACYQRSICSSVPTVRCRWASLPPWTLERELEARMGVKAKVPAWRLRFDRKYALQNGQILKRVGPPYPPERADYCYLTPRLAARLPSAARCSAGTGSCVIGGPWG